MSIYGARKWAPWVLTRRRLEAKRASEGQWDPGGGQPHKENAKMPSHFRDGSILQMEQPLGTNFTLNSIQEVPELQ